LANRIQRKRVRGWKMPPNAVYVGRPTKWGNPYKISEYERGVALDFYKSYILNKLKADPTLLDPLKDKDLACWCPLDKPCHADVLLELLKELGA